MFFQDAGNCFLQLICGTNVNMVPLFPKFTEAHFIQGVTDEDIRVILFKVGKLVAFVLNRVQVAVDFTGVDGIPDGLQRITDNINGAINIIFYAHFIFPSRF